MDGPTAIVIGAGIVGLAISRSLAEKGYRVTVFERNERAVGASVRNFGMIWPVGQPSGPLYERALLSKSIWKAIAADAGIWFEEKGSLHLAYNDLELQVIHEIAGAFEKIRPVKILDAAETLKKSEAVNPEGLKGSLFSEDEMIVEARAAIRILPEFLHSKYGVNFHFNTAISAVEYPNVRSGNRKWTADQIYICSGADFETLYPEIFSENHFTKCKLQMMRLTAQKNNWRIGPALCGGLSLVHYKSFEVSHSLQKLKDFYTSNMPEYLKLGIHVMVSQNAEGELTIGDSHEYGMVHEPFDNLSINRMILEYMQQIARFRDWQIIQSWHGIYPKKTDGATDFIFEPAEGVTIVNGLGGAGMTLSFGLAEELVNRL